MGRIEKKENFNDMDKEKVKVIRRTGFVPASVRLRSADVDEAPSRVIEGYAILFETESAPLWSDEESEAREVIDKGAITKELLDGMDIKMTMYHNREILLARSNKGAGTLKYKVDEKGVWFSFEAPNTQHGDEAVALVSRGDISGCSFAFSTRYYDESCVAHSVEEREGKSVEVYRVKSVTGVYDFTLTDCPAYLDTEVSARELRAGLQAKVAAPKDMAAIKRQIEEMSAQRVATLLRSL